MRLKKTFPKQKKNDLGHVIPIEQIEDFNSPVAGHSYSLGCVTFFISLVLNATTSLRGASKVIELTSSSLNLSTPTPSWYSGRLWLLRLGLYNLTKPKIQAEDWVWIVDHSVQIGSEKCLVIVGVRLSFVPFAERSLNHEDLEVIELKPVKKSNGKIVYQQLEDAVKKTGVPREILGDEGSDLKSGIEEFCEKHKETSRIYDIKHKTAALLKHELQDDQQWNEFLSLSTKAKQKVQQTTLSFLAPPNQRTKARYMNLDILVRWGVRTLLYLDQQKLNPTDKIDPKILQDKFGWLENYRENLNEWSQMMDVVEVTIALVRKNGLHKGAKTELEQKLITLGNLTSRTTQLREALTSFVVKESSKAKDNEKLVGSSEIIESIFGKLKRIEQNQAKSGFTGLILSVAALVSNITKELIQEVLGTISTQDVHEWYQQNIGESVQGARRKAFNFNTRKEQKRDQLLLPT